MAGFILSVTGVLFLTCVTQAHGGTVNIGQFRRLENHLYAIEGKLDSESKIRRENIKSILDQLYDLNSKLNQRSETAGEIIHQTTVTPSVMQGKEHNDSRLVHILLKAFQDEKNLNKRLRRQVEDLDEKFGNLIDVLSDLKAGNGEVRQSLDELATVLDEIRSNVSKTARQTTDIMDKLSTLDDKANELRELMSDTDNKFESCKRLLDSGYNSSGLYKIYPAQRTIPIRVFCDQMTDGGGWIVFQRREDGSENFYRTWIDYKFGFGNLEGEFWLGNEYLHLLTTSVCNELRIDLEDFETNRRFAKYGQFRVGPFSENYKLTASQYTGNATDSFSGHSGYSFSTHDRDLDTYGGGSCATAYKGAWWYSSCHSSNLNGHYYHGHHESYADGINWSSWKGYHDSLKFTEMKCR